MGGTEEEKLSGADPLIPLQSYGDMCTNTNLILSSHSVCFLLFFMASDANSTSVHYSMQTFY